LPPGNPVDELPSPQCIAAHFGAVGIVQRETRMHPSIQIGKHEVVKKSPLASRGQFIDIGVMPVRSSA
jgi:hypothetical protein